MRGITIQHVGHDGIQWSLLLRRITISGELWDIDPDFCRYRRDGDS